MIYDFIVIGAGASGLFFSAHYQNGKTLVLEAQARAGRKLLLSGGGKCNITNLQLNTDNYIGKNTKFCRTALKALPAEEILNLLKKNKIDWEKREYGQIFCRHSSEAVRDTLMKLAQKQSSEIYLGQEIQAVEHIAATAPVFINKNTNRKQATEIPAPARFAVTSNGKTHLGINLLIATGGKAWPKAGSSDFGYRLAQAFGHKIITPQPALCPLHMPEDWALHGLQGLSLQVKITIAGGNKKTPCFLLPLLFTHHGLSGPACLQISSYLKDTDKVEINFLPQENFSTLLDNPAHAKSNPLGLLRRYLPERLSLSLFSSPELMPVRQRKIAELSRKQRTAFANAIHKHTVQPEQRSFAQAESTVGGIDTELVNSENMESKLIPGLYFTGEALDVCGQLGGYNLHWAWASAWLAATAKQPVHPI